MTLIELLNAKNLKKYYTGVKGTTLAEVMFPASYTNNFDVKIFKALNGGVVKTLQAGELDVSPEARDFQITSHYAGDKRIFREKMALNERQRKELLEILNTGDTKLIENYTDQIYKQFAGKSGFLASARAVASYLTMQFLTTGIVAFIDENGSSVEGIDYGLESKFKETLAGTSVWSNTSATPLDNLVAWKEIVEKEGGNVEIALMNRVTYNKLKNHASVKAIIDKLTNVLPTEDLKRQVIEDMTGLKIVVWDEKINVKGQVRQLFPDNVVTLIPNGELGTMEYGPTPSRTDQLLKVDGDREVEDITGTYATVEVEQELKGGAVRNVAIVIESVLAPNPSITNSMFIANVG